MDTVDDSTEDVPQRRLSDTPTILSGLSGCRDEVKLTVCELIASAYSAQTMRPSLRGAPAGAGLSE